jgi:hypothetical protein
MFEVAVPGTAMVKLVLPGAVLVEVAEGRVALV